MRLIKNKWFVIPVIIIILMSILLFFFYNYINIALVNAQVDIAGFKLLDKEEKWKDTISKDFTNIGLFGGRGFFNEKDGLEIIFTGFPDVIDKPFLTNMTTTNPNHSVFGIRVGDDADKAAAILSKKGFRLEKYEEYYGFMRNKVLISLNFNEKHEITKVAVRLRVTNKQNVQF